MRTVFLPAIFLCFVLQKVNFGDLSKPLKISTAEGMLVGFNS